MKRILTLCLLTIASALALSARDVKISTIPEDARISIDGEYAGTGNIIAKIKSSDDFLVIKIERENYVTLETKLYYSEKQKSVTYTLASESSSYSGNFAEDFEFNRYGWIEIAKKNSAAKITNGHMYMYNKSEHALITHCFADFNPEVNFKLNCEVATEKVSEENKIGLVFDYMDECNYKCFVIDGNHAYFREFKEDKVVAKATNLIKRTTKRKGPDCLEITCIDGCLRFNFNGMNAIELRHRDITSTGVGFIITGNQEVIFDNLTIQNL